MLHTACKNRPAQHKGLALDVTVMSAKPEDRCMAPTWELVRGSKSGALTWEQYAERYTALLRDRWATDSAARARMTAVAEAASKGDVTLLCYCGDPAHCHRSLLAGILAQIAASRKRPLALAPLG